METLKRTIKQKKHNHKRLLTFSQSTFQNLSKKLQAVVVTKRQLQYGFVLTHLRNIFEV